MRSPLLAAFALAAVPPLAGCATAPGHHAAALPEATPFDESADARDRLNTALAHAARRGGQVRVLAIFGANWCHDSRALAGWLQSPQLQPLVAERFEVAYIDAGVPQEGHGRNLDLAAQYGVTGIVGTPTMLVLDAEGRLLNTPADAKSWRNAGSLPPEQIRERLESYFD